MSYKCGKCFKNFSDNYHLTAHLKRKTPCDKIFKCSKCGKVFISQRHLDRHDNRVTSCVADEIPVIEDGNKENRCQFCNKTYATKGSLTRHLQICNKEVNMHAIMKKLDEVLLAQKQNGTSVVNNNIVNNSLYMNTTPCIFGDEDFTLLDSKKMGKIFLENPQEFVPLLITELHANSDLPQYHNVYYDAKTDEAIVFARVMINGVMVSTWQKKPFVEVSKDLVDKAKRYPTCIPLAQNIKPNSMEEQKYCRSLEYIKKTYEHSDKDLENNKEILSKVTKLPGFFQMIEDTTYVSHMLPLIPLN
jgi:uncharacterized C2H2 Zn-finger protein